MTSDEEVRLATCLCQDKGFYQSCITLLPVNACGLALIVSAYTKCNTCAPGVDASQCMWSCFMPMSMQTLSSMYKLLVQMSVNACRLALDAMASESIYSESNTESSFLNLCHWLLARIVG